MRWYKNLYLGDMIAPEANRIVKRIKKNKETEDVYVVALAASQHDLLDLIPAWELTQKAYPKEKMQIIGLAYGKTEAIEVTQRIIDEVYLNTGAVNVVQYIQNRWEER